VREVLKQDQYNPLSVPEQIAVLLSVTEGLFDDIPVNKIVETEEKIRSAVTAKLPDIGLKIEKGEKLGDEDKKAIIDAVKNAMNM
jgi:F-type H+-transporting ATPase subunit alpha